MCNTNEQISAHKIKVHIVPLTEAIWIDIKLNIEHHLLPTKLFK